MKKNILLLLITLLSLIIILTTAQCSKKTIGVETTTKGIIETESKVSEETTKVEEATAYETEATSINETTETTISETETEKENIEGFPTIILEVYKGPTYNTQSNVCYYRIKAIVTGNPEPKVVFSRDDSKGACGKEKTQVNLKKDESYTLTVTAMNSIGSATDSIELKWGCTENNSLPVFVEFKTIEPPGFVGIWYTNTQYRTGAICSDPEGDTLFYEWKVVKGKGKIISQEGSEVVWRSPDKPGQCLIQLTLTDNRGAEAFFYIVAIVIQSQ